MRPDDVQMLPAARGNLLLVCAAGPERAGLSGVAVAWRKRGAAAGRKRGAAAGRERGEDGGKRALPMIDQGEVQSQPLRRDLWRHRRLGYRAAPLGYAGEEPPRGGVWPSAAESRRCHALDVVDHVAFRQGSVGAALLGPALQGLDGRRGVGAVLLRLERAIKSRWWDARAAASAGCPTLLTSVPKMCPKGLD